jgi:ParB family chromosome partitioning protein
MNNNIINKPHSRPALGKGLASLLPAAAPMKTVREEVLAPFSQETDNIPTKERIPGITMADIDSIVPNQFQPRRDFDEGALKELAESIKENGVIQPLVVRKGEAGRLMLIAGERRLRASKLAGLKQVPVVVRKSTDKEALEIAIVENVQREDLNCVDVALSYFQLMEDFKLTQEEVAQKVGKERSSVANHLRLLKLSEAIISDLRTEKLTYGHGKALLAVADPLTRTMIRNKIVEKGLSVRETEKLVADALTASGEQKQSRKKRGLSGEDETMMRGVSERIGRAIGSKVSYKGDSHRGAIVIEYFSREDLDRLVDQLLS